MGFFVLCVPFCVPFGGSFVYLWGGIFRFFELP